MMKCGKAYGRNLIAALAVATASIASGQESGVNTQELTIIEEIIVTAQRREQLLGEISLAITAIDGADILQSHMTDPSDLAQQIPTLQVKTIFSKSNPQIFLRGVGVNDDTALSDRKSTV